MLVRNTFIRIMAVVLEFVISLYIIEKEIYPVLSQLVFFQIFCMPLAAGSYLYFIKRKITFSVVLENRAILFICLIGASVLAATSRYLEIVTLIVTIAFYIRMARRESLLFSNFIFFGMLCKNIIILFILISGVVPSVYSVILSVFISCVLHELLSRNNVLNESKNCSSLYGILIIGFLMQFLMYSELLILDYFEEQEFLASFRVIVQLIFLVLIVQQASNQTHIRTLVAQNKKIELNHLAGIGFRAMFLSLVFVTSVNIILYVFCGNIMVIPSFSVAGHAFCQSFDSNIMSIIYAQILVILSIFFGPVIMIAKLSDKHRVLAGILTTLVFVKIITSYLVVKYYELTSVLAISPAGFLLAANLIVLIVLVRGGVVVCKAHSTSIR